MTDAAPTVDMQALADSLSRLSEQHDGAILQQSLMQVLESCVQLFDIDGGGLMLADEHSDLRYVVALKGLSQLLEDAQLETGEGPCVDTFLYDAVITCADVTTDERWPKLAGVLADKNIGAVLGIPIRLSDFPVGSLDIYRSEAREWDPAEVAALTRYGQIAEAMLAAAVHAEQAGTLAAQLSYALEYRQPIERGVGYLMARDGLGQAEAFNRLRLAARSARRKIGDVARDLLSTGRLPEES
jgi:GAF domain-containing protein